MAHLKSNKLATIRLENGFRKVTCYPEIKIGILQKPDGSYAAYGWHFYTDNSDENNPRIEIFKHFERPITEAQINFFASQTDTTGMNETERRHTQLVTATPMFLAGEDYIPDWGISGSDYEEVIHQENEQE